jgi:acyl-CoA:acyl-CoA alkyltransferase
MRNPGRNRTRAPIQESIRFKQETCGDVNLMSGNVAIEAVACEIPDIRMTSAAIEEEISGTLDRLGVEKGLLEGLTGIRERRFWEPGVKPSEVATRAARKVIEKSGIDPAKIGIIINTSVCKDYIEPSVACLVHGNLKLPFTCVNYDIGNACLGFLNGMNVISLMIEAGHIAYGLIVDGEGSRDVIEATIRRLKAPEATLKTYRENFATLTLGSGAAAMLLCHKDQSRTGHVINGGVSLAATEHNRLCLGQPDHMVTDAQKLLVAGVELAARTWKRAGEKFRNWCDETISRYIPHQVSQANMHALNQTLGLTAEKVQLTFPWLGNAGPAALPITLAIAEEEGKLNSGDHLALMGIGSGLNCSMMSVTW